MLGVWTKANERIKLEQETVQSGRNKGSHAQVKNHEGKVGGCQE